MAAWGSNTHLLATECVEISDVSGVRSPFSSTLTFTPLNMSDVGQYSCGATAASASPYITTSTEGRSIQNIPTVNGICTKKKCVDII